MSLESVYHGQSTLLLATFPICAWHRLPDTSAYRFVGFVRSDNLLVLKSSRNSTPIKTPSKSSTSDSPILAPRNFDKATQHTTLRKKRSFDIGPDLASSVPEQTTDSSKIAASPRENAGEIPSTTSPPPAQPGSLAGSSQYPGAPENISASNPVLPQAVKSQATSYEEQRPCHWYCSNCKMGAMSLEYNYACLFCHHKRTGGEITR